MEEWQPPPPPTHPHLLTLTNFPIPNEGGIDPVLCIKMTAKDVPTAITK